MKPILATLFFCVIAAFAFSQSRQLKIQDQYGAALKQQNVTVNGTSYITNDSGFISISAPSETLVVKAGNHEEKSVLLSKVSDNTIELHKSFSWKDLLNPMFYIVNGGLWLLLFIVFAETGLFAGFFLPGDSLLFVAGIYSTELIKSIFPFNNEYLNLFVLIALISAMGIIGNSVGYWFGKRIGPSMYQWKDTMLFKQKYLHQAHDFYEKHGGIAIIGARFLPLVRTFAPIIAGIVQMDKKKFAYYNIVGCIAWVGSMILGGHFLQKWLYEWFGFDLKSHLEYIIIVIVLITTTPVIYKMFFSKKKSPTIELSKSVLEEEQKV